MARRDWPVTAATSATASLTEARSSAWRSSASRSSACEFALRGGRRNDDHDLAARFGRRRGLARQGRQVAAPHLLVELGELAADRGLARPQPFGEVGERRREPRAGLEQDERGRNAVELGDAGAPRRLLRRQESFEEEPVGRQRAHHQRREHRGGARHRRHARALLARRAHELVAGVGDQRGAGVGDQRHRRALGEPRQQPGPGLGGVVVVIGRERGGDARSGRRACG